MFSRLAGRFGPRGRTAPAARRVDAPRDCAASPLRLLSAEMRAPGLALLGHAHCLEDPAADVEMHAQAVAAIAQRMLDFADELDDQATSAGEGRALSPERLRLGPLVGDVVSSVAGSLAPGRRSFRFSPELGAF